MKRRGGFVVDSSGDGCGISFPYDLYMSLASLLFFLCSLLILRPHFASPRFNLVRLLRVAFRKATTNTRSLFRFFVSFFRNYRDVTIIIS